MVPPEACQGEMPRIRRASADLPPTRIVPGPDPGGFWDNESLLDLATPQGFARSRSDSLSQKPPGLRKVGTPDSAETPAPVNAATRRPRPSRSLRCAEIAAIRFPPRGRERPC